MKKFIFILFISTLIVLQSCKSVENWAETPVLSQKVIDLSFEYINKYELYKKQQELSSSMDLSDNPSSDELEKKLNLEKEVALASNIVLQGWFNLFIELQLDPNYTKAYKGHYYFRRAIQSLRYIEMIRDELNIENQNIIDKKHLEELVDLEDQSRLFIAQQIKYNYSDINVEQNFKELKKLYRFVK